MLHLFKGAITSILAFLLSGSLLSQELTYTLEAGEVIEEKATLTSSNFTAIATIENKYYYRIQRGSEGTWIASCNADLSFNEAVEIGEIEGIENAKIHSWHFLEDRLFLCYTGTSAETEKGNWGIFAREIATDPLEAKKPKLIFQVPAKKKEVKHIEIESSADKKFLGVSFTQTSSGGYSLYHCAAFDSDLNLIHKHVNDRWETEDPLYFRSLFVADETGELFLFYDDAVLKVIALGGFAPIKDACVLRLSVGENPKDYKLELEDKGLIGQSFYTSEDGKVLLDLFWYSKSDTKITGRCSYDFEEKMMMNTVAFDPAFNRPFRIVEALKIVDAEKPQANSCHFFLHKRLETTYAGNQLVVLEKISSNLRDSDGPAIYQGDLLVYLFNENNEIQQQIAVKKLTQTSGNSQENTESTIIHLQGDYLYLLYFARVNGIDNEKEKVIYMNRNFTAQWSYFITRIDLKENTQVTANFLTSTNNFTSDDGFYLNSFFKDSENSIVIAKSRVVKKNLLRLTFP